MLLCFLLTMTLSRTLLVSGAEFKKHVQNSVYPFDVDPPSYNIESWVKQLHLQQCAFVEVGDRYFALFVENRPRRYDRDKGGIKEYFLGLCDDDTLSKWSLCPASLQRKRAEDCDFYTKSMYNTRVHRRLCDLTLLALNAPQCNCANDLADSRLYKVQGFPTCFKPPLPDSLCGDNNVCGLAGCDPRTINRRVHSIKCDRNCKEDQPFCEPCDRKSSRPRRITSFWTDWSNPFCTDTSCVSQFDEAICINRETGNGDIDCLGPGTSCCTSEMQMCKCHVYEEGGATKVFRTFAVPQPEMVEYMSEEDFINSIPLRSGRRVQVHRYPYDLPREVRSNLGKAFKQTLANIYEAFPLKISNVNRRKHCLNKIKATIMAPLMGKKGYNAKSANKTKPTTISTAMPTSTSTEEESSSSETSSANEPAETAYTVQLPSSSEGSADSDTSTAATHEHKKPAETNEDDEECKVCNMDTEETAKDNPDAPHEVEDALDPHRVKNSLYDVKPHRKLSPSPHINTNGVHHRERVHQPHNVGRRELFWKSKGAHAHNESNDYEINIRIVADDDHPARSTNTSATNSSHIFVVKKSNQAPEEDAFVWSNHSTDCMEVFMKGASSCDGPGALNRSEAQKPTRLAVQEFQRDADFKDITEKPVMKMGVVPVLQGSTHATFPIMPEPYRKAKNRLLMTTQFDELKMHRISRKQREEDIDDRVLQFGILTGSTSPATSTLRMVLRSEMEPEEPAVDSTDSLDTFKEIQVSSIAPVSESKARDLKEYLRMGQKPVERSLKRQFRTTDYLRPIHHQSGKNLAELKLDDRDDELDMEEHMITFPALVVSTAQLIKYRVAPAMSPHDDVRDYHYVDRTTAKTVGSFGNKRRRKAHVNLDDLTEGENVTPIQIDEDEDMSQEQYARPKHVNQTSTTKSSHHLADAYPFRILRRVGKLKRTKSKSTTQKAAMARRPKREVVTDDDDDEAMLYDEDDEDDIRIEYDGDEEEGGSALQSGHERGDPKIINMMLQNAMRKEGTTAS